MQKNLKAEKQRVSPSEMTLMGFYGVILFAVYYTYRDFIQVGSLQLYIPLVLYVILIGFTLVYLLVKTDLERAKMVGLHTLVLMLPSVTLIFSSIPVWVIEAVDFSIMRRGVVDQLYSITMIMAMGGLLYVFGAKAFKLNLTAALISYLAKLLPIIAENGLVPFMNEFMTLLITFANETGPIMKAAELDEATLSMGVLLVGLLLALIRNKKDWLLWIELALGVFCFVTGLKRITIVAAIGAAILGFVLVRVTKKGTKRLWIIHAVAITSVVLCFVYVVLSKLGIFQFLEDIGIDTMGRAYIAKQVDSMYSLSPLFLGHGTGFISRSMSDWDSTFKALHNGLLQIYIDNGFFGFWLWGMTYLPLRTRHFAKHSGHMAAIVALCCTMAVIFTALTDNTIFFSQIAGTTAMDIMYFATEEETA